MPFCYFKISWCDGSWWWVTGTTVFIRLLSWWTGVCVCVCVCVCLFFCLCVQKRPCIVGLAVDGPPIGLPRWACSPYSNHPNNKHRHSWPVIIHYIKRGPRWECSSSSTLLRQKFEALAAALHLFFGQSGIFVCMPWLQIKVYGCDMFAERISLMWFILYWLSV